MSESAQSKAEAAPPKKRKTRIIIKKKGGGHGGAHGGSWKVAYADFVTAMMAFFLLMWLLNMTDSETKKALSVYFQDEETRSKTLEQLGDALKLSNADRIGTPDIKLTNVEKLQYSMIIKIREFMSANPELQPNSEASADGRGVLYYVSSDMMFEPGSATLKPEAIKILNHVAQLMQEFNFDLVVRGHTDDQDQKTSAYPSNWELSAARAAASLRYLIKNGQIPPGRMRAIGYAETRPLTPNTTPEGRAKNRRVEFYYHRPDQASY